MSGRTTPETLILLGKRRVSVTTGDDTPGANGERECRRRVLRPTEMFEIDVLRAFPAELFAGEN